MYVNALIDIGVNKVPSLPVDAVIKAEGREFIFVWEKENMETQEEHAEGEKHEEGEAHEKEISLHVLKLKPNCTIRFCSGNTFSQYSSWR